MPDDYSDEDVIARWEEFLESSDYRLKVIEVADHYPEQRSLVIPYSMLDLFDPDFSDLILQHPVKCLHLGKQAVRKMLPPGREGVDVHLRLNGLPAESKVEIRRIRSEHLGKLISVEGLVRKATEVRPKIIDALFQCMRCGAVIKEAQEGMFFKEPLECSKDQGGCERTSSSTKFKLLSEESKYVDTQKIEIQESPEGLRGGAQPERLTGYIEDDLAGSVAPGDRVIMNGVVRSVQKGGVQKSTLFDINLDVLSVEFKTHEYEDVAISQEDEDEILAQSRDPALFKKIIGSISPTIYGYDREKEAIALQLFGGVRKSLDDGTKIRGDIHVLLVGDPGVAKCVTGDAEVLLGDCSTRPIKDIVEEAISKGNVQTVDDGVWAPLEMQVMSFSMRGAIEPAKAVRAWKRTAPPKMLRFKTKGGRTLTVTPTHPLFVQNGAQIQFRAAKSIYLGQNIAIATGAGWCGPDETHGRRRGLDWDAVESIEPIDAPEPFVYDLEVDVTHNFVTNDIISHNSQILRYMSDLAPRGIYASGKSSSAAGLCVAPDSKIWVDGKQVKIGEFVESKLTAPKEAKPGIWAQETNGHKISSMKTGLIEGKELRSVWRINTPSFLVEITTAGGHRLTLTPETRVMARRFGMVGAFSRCESLTPGDEALVRVDDEMKWVRLEGKREVREDLPPYVYDLTVDDSHCFIANDFAVHNTAAAVKDDFGEGRWTLEAGALVLADMGLASIDELDKMTDQDRSSMHEAMESQCYDEETEVLTEDGWKRFPDLVEEDRVASLSPSGYLEYQKPLAYFSSEYEGRVFKIQTSQLDLAVTPNHNMYVSVHRRAGEWGEYGLRRMDLLPQGKQLKFKKNALWKGRDSKWFVLPPVMKFKNQNDPGALTEARRYGMDDWLEFLGYFISEGSVQFTNSVPYRVHISQVSSKDKIERIENCLNRLGFKFSYDGHNFAISDKQLASYLSKMGKTGDKHVPRDILQLSSRQLGILLEALMLGDGTTSKTNGHRIYCTSSKRLADDVQEIALKCGVAGNVRLISEPGKKSIIKGRKIESTLPHFNVSILDGNGRNTCETMASAVGSLVLGTYILNSGMTKCVELSRDSSIDTVEYSGMVHCVEVPNHVIYVRRNGMPVWCGNSVSVAKAGITARLQCRCSILGAANPKYGRFEESQFIADQIDLPPALMSRFDMIFAMTDKPEAEKDARITKHILSAHRRGEIFENEDPMVEDSDDIKRMLLETEGLKPTYSKEFFRKYIAYSKRFSPILSDDAMRLITDNYLMIRKQGEGEGKSVPITARQLEAYVRLSEASARARLSKVVTLDDAKRAVGIVEYYLRKIAGEGGGLDIDIIATGTSKSQREQILVIRDLIRNNAEKSGIGIEQLIMLAKEENIPEERVRTLLKRLADNGEVYSPQGGFYKLASEGNE